MCYYIYGDFMQYLTRISCILNILFGILLFKFKIILRFNNILEKQMAINDGTYNISIYLVYITIFLIFFNLSLFLKNKHSMKIKIFYILPIIAGILNIMFGINNIVIPILYIVPNVFIFIYSFIYDKKVRKNIKEA